MRPLLKGGLRGVWFEGLAVLRRTGLQRVTGMYFSVLRDGSATVSLRVEAVLPEVEA